MDEETSKAIAAQLRLPSGEHAIQVGERMNEGNLHINLYSIEALQLVPGDYILEIGMGNGSFVKDILCTDSSIKYTGCDFSEVMVNEARKKNENFISKGSAEFLNVDANKLPFDKNVFDKVFSVNTIYFWDQPQVVLAEIWRVLKPKGQIIISVRPKSVMQNYPFVKYGFKMFDAKDLAEILIQNNFNLLDTIEKTEPDLEINGVQTETATLIVKAEKK